MTSRRSDVLNWIDQGTIAPDQISRVLEITGIRPDGPHWTRFIDRLLLALGAMSLACAAVFFLAYNWAEMGRFAQFGLVQLAMLNAIVIYWRLGPDGLTARISLLVAAILLGALLAFYHQTYQTGADPWQLFAGWALLLIPWVLVSRFPPMWLLWLALVNVAVILYVQVFAGPLWLAFGQEHELLWLLFVLNTIAWLAWEMAASRIPWLQGDEVWGRWPVRLISIASGSLITALVLRAIFDQPENGWQAWLAWFSLLGILYFIYRRRIRDLFILAGASTSVIVCITSLLARIVINNSFDAISLLLVSLAVIGQATAAAIWLRRIHTELDR